MVIYEENHSFDNLYGTWGDVSGQHVEGLADATAAKRDPGRPRTARRTPACCRTTSTWPRRRCPPRVTDAATGSTSHFTNDVFDIDDYIEPEDKTCPAPGVFAPNGVLKDSEGAEPGGCTRDLVHRFYQEQYQIDGGKQDRYTTGSDAVGLTQGVYETQELPIYRYLHSKGAPKYVIADRFFQGAFGGSFLNHQWLIAARARSTPAYPGADPQPRSSVLDANRMVNDLPAVHADRCRLRRPADAGVPGPCQRRRRRACGNFAVNTVQPAQPAAATAARRSRSSTTRQYPNIGDRMSDAGISWNWYSGGWDDAESGKPGPLFQYHHQPFNYFADYAPGQPGRAHLKDETEFIAAAQQRHAAHGLVRQAVRRGERAPGLRERAERLGPPGRPAAGRSPRGTRAGNTLVVVTYDEFGGQWDHVSPPGTGATVGAHDAWGPGTRIPALVLSRSFKHSGVDHTVYDTTSIMATIERSFGLAPVATRDAVVNDLAPAVAAGGRH